MQLTDKILNIFLMGFPSICLVAAVGIILYGSYWFLIGRHTELGNERKFFRQILMVGLTVVGILIIVVFLPIKESFRNQIIGLIGIFISGIVAFSSTSIVANFMSGIMLRITKPFRTGDFIRVGSMLGRVSERGLFDTEIQSENRELIAIPNSYLIGNPVSTIRSSGAIVSITLSLGYDVHHARIEPLLMEAAEGIGLLEPFVHILELGNYAVTYRVSGLLEDVKWFITARSNLCRAVLDTLHDQQIEIMSPSFMNQRRIGDAQKIIPAFAQDKQMEEAGNAEKIIFDKAEQAEKIEHEKKELTEYINKLEAKANKAPKEEKEQIKKELKQTRERLADIENAKTAPGEEEMRSDHPVGEIE